MRSLPGTGERYGEPSVEEEKEGGDRRCRFSMANSVTDLLLISPSAVEYFATGLVARVWVRLIIWPAAAEEEEEEIEEEAEEDTEADMMRGEAEAGRRDCC